MIVDATCAPQDIRYPQDSSLLNEARENLEGMIDILHDSSCGQKPRTCRQNARRSYIKFSKKRKKTFKEIRKTIKSQLQYIRRDLRIVEEFLENGKSLPKWHTDRLATIRLLYELYEQQLSMYINRTRTVSDRIVSLGQPWIRPIVRGKAKTNCEFGAKLELSVSDGYVRLKHTSFDAYNESTNFIDIIERYRVREGHYPERVLVDGIYRTRDNLQFFKKNGIQISGKPLGRPSNDASADKKRIRTDEIDRIEVERQISHAKRSFGLGLIRIRLKETSETSIALSIVVLNLSRIERNLCAVFNKLLELLTASWNFRKLTSVQ